MTFLYLKEMTNFLFIQLGPDTLNLARTLIMTFQKTQSSWVMKDNQTWHSSSDDGASTNLWNEPTVDLVRMNMNNHL